MKTAIQKMNNAELHQATLHSANLDKQSTLNLLDHLAEVEHRKLFLERSFSSLWEYSTQYLGLSESQAFERIASMRLIKKLPEAKTALQNGATTLTAMAKLSGFAKRENLNPKESGILLQKCLGKSTKDVERILMGNSKNPEIHLISERLKVINAEFTRLTLDVDQEFMKKLRRAKELHRNPSIDLKNLFLTLLDSYINKKDLEKKTIKQSESPESPKIYEQDLSSVHSKCKSMPIKDARASVPKPPTPFSLRSIEVSRYIPQSLKIRIQQRSKGQCEYIDSLTRRRCQSRQSLQYDHFIPFAKNGPTCFENLRHLCPAHNQFHAIQTFGVKKMTKYHSPPYS